mmetsp:Transcript_5603/g.15194  ORF Transcript_5603/g.15194 Transcript_5603/m.15194 type:complete len:103 (-) Transcript_5603:36-344(-)
MRCSLSACLPACLFSNAELHLFKGGRQIMKEGASLGKHSKNGSALGNSARNARAMREQSKVGRQASKEANNYSCSHTEDKSEFKTRQQTSERDGVNVLVELN